MNLINHQKRTHTHLIMEINESTKWNDTKWGPKPNNFKFLLRKKRNDLFSMLIIILQIYLDIAHLGATSINYGISQTPITDISQLMPTLCQNQTVICEGSFCIPGLRRCVCDLRRPVQFGRYCLRQVDIETKCFVSNQCNHTIKDAVCIDTGSNIVLDVDSSRYKLDQWQQLNELREASKSALSNQETVKQRVAAATNLPLKSMFLLDNLQNRPIFVAHEDIAASSFRNSPYEINYHTPELLHQNHTRRKASGKLVPNNDTIDGSITMSPENTSTSQTSSKDPIRTIIDAETTALPMTTIASTESTSPATFSPSTIISFPQNDLNNALMTTSSSAQTTTLTSELSKKKMIVKTPSWPPGVCSCPLGYMFDPMLRKCLSLSLVDSHCLSDNDCKQIRLTHCASELRKCQCDEPLIWNQTDLACQRPRPVTKSDVQAANQSKDGFFDTLVSSLLTAKVLPDQTMLLMIFVILVIICTLVLLTLIVRCFSTSKSALISPKNSKKKKSNATNLLTPKSPYATLRKPEHRPNTPLASFTQAARGRILNYDFEQDNSIIDARGTRSPQSQGNASNTLNRDEQPNSHHHHYGTLSNAASKTSGSLAGQMNKNKSTLKDAGSSVNRSSKTSDRTAEACLELTDNVSLGGQLDSESKSESTSVLAIPAPPSSQTPPYMLTSAMRGQGSAIAAAAAAVANRRMQMAHKKSLTEATNSKVPNGTPVFL